MKLAAIIGVTLLLGSIYISVIPPWQSPDEPTHFEYVKVLAAGDVPWAPRSSPAIQEQIILSMARHQYWRRVRVEEPSPIPQTFRTSPFLGIAPSQIGKNPPLYYWLASRVLLLVPALSVEAELYRLRILSLFFTTLTVFFIWAAAGELFGKDSPLVPASAGLAVFIPQFMVIGTSVSPDPCINFFGAVAIYLAMRYRRIGLTFRRMLILLLWHGIGMLVNYKFLILLAVFPVVVLINVFRQRGAEISRRKLVLGLLVLISVSLAAYTFLVWNFPLLARVFIVRVNRLYLTIADFLRGETYFPPGYWPWFNLEAFKSFWLKYGWLTYELPLFFYNYLRIVSMVALAGVGIFIGRMLLGKVVLPAPFRDKIATLIVYAGAALGAYYLFWGLQPGQTSTQGRHLFIVMPAWVILFVFGWNQLLPERWSGALCAVILTAFLLFTVVAIVFYILPTFY